MTKPPPLFEVKAGLKDVDDEVIRTGAMIALRPRQDHIDRLAVDGGEEPAELHCTILFMGKGADYTYDTRARIIDAMREVALKHRQVTADGWNIGIFNPNGEQPCITLGVGGTELVMVRDSIIGALQGMDLLQVPEQHEPWVPHVTLNYTDDPKLALDYLDLTGEVVFDAIRVVFSGIVDDIPLQSVSSTNEGYAGGNRYAFAPPNLMKSMRLNVDHPLFTKQSLGKCRYCQGDATKKIGIDGGAHIVSCEGHEARARRDAGDTKNLDAFLGRTESKVRHVRTAAGARRFGQPIGSVIVADGSTLKNVKEVESEYEGYNKYNVGGSPIYTAKEGGKFVAYDADDNVMGSAKTEDELLSSMDKISSLKNKPAAAKVSSRSGHRYNNFKTVTSEYEGYDKYTAPDGTAVYRDQATNHYYDADDNELSDVKLRRMNEGGEGKPAVVQSDETRKTVDTVGMPEVLNPKQQQAFAAALRSASMQIEETEAKGKLAKIAEGIEAGTITPADVIKQIEQIQRKASGSGTRYALGSTLSRMKNAMRLYQEAKMFASLVEMDPFLRASAMQFKLITPGGRVGSDKPSGSRSNGENWIERSGPGKLPKYIRIVYNGLVKAGHSGSRAYALAIGAMKRWARGGDNVRPAVQAAAAKALAEWEAMKAAA